MLAIIYYCKVLMLHLSCVVCTLCKALSCYPQDLSTFHYKQSRTITDMSTIHNGKCANVTHNSRHATPSRIAYNGKRAKNHSCPMTQISRV